MTKVPYRARLTEENLKNIKKTAKKHNYIHLNTIVNTIISEHYKSDLPNENIESILQRHLYAATSQVEELSSELAFFREIFSTFLIEWLMVNAPVPRSQERTARLLASKRFKTIMEKSMTSEVITNTNFATTPTEKDYKKPESD